MDSRRKSKQLYQYTKACSKTSKRESSRSKLRLNLERLESREMLAADMHTELGDAHLGDARILKNVVPAAYPVKMASLNLQPSTDPIAQPWSTLLKPYGAQLLNNATTTPTFRVSDARFDASIGATHVYLQQTLNGYDIVNAYANFTVLNDGSVIGANSSFVPTIVNQNIDANLAPVSAKAALISLAGEYQWPQPNENSVATSSALLRGKTVNTLVAPTLAREPVAYESVYAYKADGSLELAWRLNVQAAVGDSWLDASVSALDGSVLFAADWNSDARYQVFAFPKESPTDGGRTNVTNPQTIASPFGWHDTNGVAGAESTLTIGNNTRAYRDTNANNLPDPGTSPSGGASLIFSAPMDLTQQPAAYSDATTLNLFYTTNVLHDVFASKGFDAAAGNFQTNNYGAGGLGGDPLLAEDQDGSGVNNANMATPPDGTSPRMQMFVWTDTAINRNSSFDNGVIAHEFGHGVTNRLTGGPANSSALTTIQSAGMGEGWSDFFALMTTQVATDTASLGRGIATYLVGEPATGLGIRTQRYSYDFTANSHVFSDIVNSTSVHFVGETWAATLWDLNWALIGGSSIDPSLPNAGLGFVADLNSSLGGNNLAMRLVVQALKLQPANPTFLQARDAILQADQLLTGGLYQSTIWRVFARRGIGLSANSGPSSNSTAVVAAFDVPIQGSIVFRRDGLLGSAFASVEGLMLPISVAGGTQTVNFSASAGGKTSFVVTPTNSSAVLTIRILPAGGGAALAVGTSLTPGGIAKIGTWGQPVDGDYVLSVSSTVPTGLKLEAARNASLESQFGDTSASNILNINNSFRSMTLGGLNGVVGKSTQGFQITKASNVARFIDISTTGTNLLLSDDSSASVTTTVGNALFPAGSTSISNNGGILSSALATTLNFQNTSIADLPPESLVALYPFWDDIDSETGAVYWQELVVNGINTLIVQWDNRPHFNGIGSTTFQLQVLANGPVLARFAYKDVNFGNAAVDNGKSASIGLVTATQNVQYSFNTVSVADGDYIDFRLPDDVDEYRFTASAGQRIGVAFDALFTTELFGSSVQLLSPTGTVLASAIPRPLGASTTIANYDLGILNYTIPASGNYLIRMNGKSNFKYYIAVTENLSLDTENQSGTLTPVRVITAPGSVMGHLRTADAVDAYDVSLAVGQRLRVTLTRPSDGIGYLPANTLTSRLSILRPNQTTGATTTAVNAAGQLIVQYTATQAGLHRINIARLTGFGEYYAVAELIPAIAPLTSSSPSFVSSGSSSLSNDVRQLNLAASMDVNRDKVVSSADLQLIVNAIIERKSRGLSSTSKEAATDALFDLNKDGLVSALDASLISNYLQSQQGA